MLPNTPPPALNYVLHFKDGSTESVSTRVGHQLHRTHNALHRISINDPSYLLDVIVNGKTLDYVKAVHTSGQVVTYKYNTIKGNPETHASSSLLETLEQAVSLIESGSVQTTGSAQ